MPTLFTKGVMSVQSLGFGSPQGGGGGGGWIATWTSNGEFTYPRAIPKVDNSGKFYFLATTGNGTAYYGSFDDTFNIQYATYTYYLNTNFNSSVFSLDGLGNLYAVGAERRTVNIEASINKIDANGVPVFEYVDSQAGNFYSGFGSTAIDSSGNIMCSGTNGKNIPPSSRAGLSFAKFSPSGSLLTFASNDAPITNFYYPIASNFDALDKMYVANRIQDGSNAYVASTFLKVDNTGSLIWAKEINGNLKAEDITAKSDGTFYTVMGDLSSGLYYLIAIDTSGNILWQKTFDDAGTPLILTYVAVDSFGNIYINAVNNTAQGIIKLDYLGNIVWQKRMDAIYVDSITCDSIGNVYVGSAFDVGVLLFMKLPADGIINGTYTIDSYPITIVDATFTSSNGTFSMSSFSYGSGTWSYNNTSYSSNLSATTATIQSITI